MPVTFQILTERSLVYVNMSGLVSADESFEVFGEYVQHKDYRPPQNQLIDMSDVTDVDQNFPKLMEMQAQKADAMVGGETETLLVYLAPTDVAFALASTILKSWQGLDGVIARVARTEEQALDILGQREKTVNDLVKVGN